METIVAILVLIVLLFVVLIVVGANVTIKLFFKFKQEKEKLKIQLNKQKQIEKELLTYNKCLFEVLQSLIMAGEIDKEYLFSWIKKKKKEVGQFSEVEIYEKLERLILKANLS